MAATRRAQARLAGLRMISRLLPKRTRRPERADARVLLIRPDHLGDCVLTLPAIAQLRESLPDAHLSVLAGPWSAEIFRRGPRLDALRTLSFPGFTRASEPWIGEPYALLVREALKLRRQRFDVAVVLRPDHWWGALLAALAGIPVRIGFEVPECRPFLTDSLSLPDSEHSAALSFMLLGRVCEALGVTPADRWDEPVFHISRNERDQARIISERIEPSEGPFVILHPGSGASLKNWPPESWAAVLDSARSELGARTLIAHGPGEELIADSIRQAAREPHPVVTTERDVGLLAALLERADIVLGSDSGPLHLAAAVGTPTIRLYGPTDPAVYGPWPTVENHIALRSDLPCSPCGFLASPPCGAISLPECMATQTPESALAALRWLLSGTRRTPAAAG